LGGLTSLTIARVRLIRLDRSGRFDAAALHAAVREVDARVPVTNVATLADIRMGFNPELRFLDPLSVLRQE
jgi:hypothetical protein